MKKLSIIMPVYNEAKTLAAIVKKVLTQKYPVPIELIIVNDVSTDGSGEIAKKLAKSDKRIKYFAHETPKNQGKGAAVRTGITNATGEYVIIQDADLEYDPSDIARLVVEADKHTGKKMAFYGSRLTEAPTIFGEGRTPLLLHYFGNRFLSLITSGIYGQWLTDMETCYKLMPTKALESMKLRARGFELEPELTAKLLKEGYTIKEIPIQTKPRGFEEGKKLRTFYDGRKALWALLKYRFTD